MNPSTTCIDATVMRQLAARPGDISEHSELEAHLKACDRCRQLLDKLTAETARSGLDAPTGPEVPAKAKSAELSGIRRAELAFLDAPRDPANVGRLGQYELIQVVGRGAIGAVFKAVDDALQRTVAVKMMSPELSASDTARRRFIREARAAAQITHENVVTIHAVHEEHRVPFLVMQFIEGCSLQERIRKDELTLKEIVRISKEMADGLAAAHDKGLVHRDIKPANIILEAAGDRVKITDFGLARAVDDASISTSDCVVGTPLYMSPEQARGNDLDCRSDLFSLGAVIYAMCTGNSPFQASSTMAVLERVRRDDPSPIRDRNPSIPDWLEGIIGKLLEKNPDNRYQTAAEVSKALALHSRSARPAGKTKKTLRPVPATKPRRRMPLMLGAAALLVMASVALLIAKPWKAANHDKKVDTTEAKGGNSGLSLTVNVPVTASDVVNTGLGAMNTGVDAVNTGIDAVNTGLKVFNAFSSSSDKSRYQAAFKEGGPGQMAHGGDGLLAVPFGERVAIMESAKGAIKRDCKSTNGRIACVAFSPDGRRLAGGGEAKEDNLLVWDVNSGQLQQTLKGHTGPVTCVAFSPADADCCASASEDGSVIVWDLKAGKPKHVHRDHKGPARAVAFDRAGERIVTGGDDKKVCIRNVAGGPIVRELSGHTAPILWIAFDAKGDLFACGSDVEAIVWKADALDQVAFKKTPAGWLAFSPDGLTLFTAARDNGDDRRHTVTLWNSPKWEKRTSYQLKSKGGQAVYHLSADGNLLFGNRALPDGETSAIYAYDAATGRSE